MPYYGSKPLSYRRMYSAAGGFYVTKGPSKTGWNHARPGTVHTLSGGRRYEVQLDGSWRRFRPTAVA